MKKVLVTGGCGFIGSNLIDALVKQSHDVTCIDDMSGPRDDAASFMKKHEGKVTFVPVCYASDVAIELVEGGNFDVVFHVAAIPRVGYSVEHPFLTTDTNIAKTVKLLEACVSGDVKRFIFSSSSSVYGGADILPTPNTHGKDPKSPYAWQKSCIEDLLTIFSSLYDFDALSLRYFNVYGPGQFGGSAYSTAVSAWCHAIKNGTSLRKDGTGEQSRDMCYVDNVVEANILASNVKTAFNGECYNVACGDRTSNNEVLQFLEGRFGKLDIVEAPFRKGDVMHTQADISKTKSDLGYEPKVRFWDGLELTLGWWGLKK